MKLKTIFFIVLVVAVLGLSAQDGSFMRSTVVYEDTLAMDLFVPDEITDQLRPVLIYVHGGGFSGGQRDHENHIWFCEYFAKRGWITVTISYHLTMKGKSFSCDQPVANKINTLLVSAQNINQATAYLLTQGDRLQMNTDKIVIAGSSAGAEAVIHAAYWNKSQEEILPNDFQYGGAISMAGALLDDNWITKDSAIPTALFHGTCDNLVPYGTAPHHYCGAEQPGFMMLFGSESIADRLTSIGKGSYLVTDCGGGHEWNVKPIWPDYIYMIEDFLENDVLANQQRRIHQVFKEGKHQCDRGSMCGE